MNHVHSDENEGALRGENVEAVRVRGRGDSNSRMLCNEQHVPTLLGETFRMNTGGSGRLPGYDALEGDGHIRGLEEVAASEFWCVPSKYRFSVMIQGSYRIPSNMSVYTQLVLCKALPSRSTETKSLMGLPQRLHGAHYS